VPVFFSYQFSDFRVRNSSAVKRWLLRAFKSEKKKLKQLNITFCSDKELLKINNDFLKHNYFTDIITFQYNKKTSAVESEVYISVERVKNNASELGMTFTDELHRVMIHGVLHLCGYKDKTAKDKTVITKKEDAYLLKRNF
jgi:probable rRNA maturation factor